MMKKSSTRHTTTPKKVDDLGVKDAAQVVGGKPTESLSINFTKVEYRY
jgi:hypothetical protein